MAPRLAQVEIEYIPWALGQGHSMSRIAEHLDRARHTIQRYAGMRLPRGRPCKTTAEQRTKIVGLVPDLGYRGAAKALGLDACTVRHAAMRLGVRSPHKRRKYQRRRPAP